MKQYTDKELKGLAHVIQGNTLAGVIENLRVMRDELKQQYGASNEELERVQEELAEVKAREELNLLRIAELELRLLDRQKLTEQQAERACLLFIARFEPYMVSSLYKLRKDDMEASLCVHRRQVLLCFRDGAQTHIQFDRVFYSPTWDASTLLHELKHATADDLVDEVGEHVVGDAKRTQLLRQRLFICGLLPEK